jgi:hypothetical protein
MLVNSLPAGMAHHTQLQLAAQASAASSSFLGGDQAQQSGTQIHGYLFFLDFKKGNICGIFHFYFVEKFHKMLFSRFIDYFS